mmetsp:Transcript_23399/g.54354  ORF Transcript_23399/g.54354 Transcript_23399/m.54354 type:complete len:105 (-) Transcript_23399:485-799(-)
MAQILSVSMNTQEVRSDVVPRDVVSMMCADPILVLGIGRGKMGGENSRRPSRGLDFLRRYPALWGQSGASHAMVSIRQFISTQMSGLFHMSGRRTGSLGSSAQG